MIRFGILLIALIIAPMLLRADALVVSQAMFADTIAEYFVEENHVRVELEIGAGDLPIFRNLLPDALHRDLGYGDEPLADRMQRFFAQELAILVEGEPLRGGVLDMGPETRVRRDPVTGDPLASDEDDPEVVIRATLIYPFEEARPASLGLVAPPASGIGFVLYHQGVAVNDFRYLANNYEVTLDWEDPWYSAFNTRSLRRQYFAPMAGFIYVEPFEVRKEIIVRPADIQRLTDLGLEGMDTIPAELQPQVKERIVAFLDDHFAVRINGEPVEGTIDRVNFLQRTLRSSIVVDGQDQPLLPATVGVITVFATDGLPDRVDMDWDLFDERMPMVPASTVDQAGPLPTFLEPDFNVLTWENFLKNPRLPTLTDIRQPPTTMQRLARWGQWVFAALALLALVMLLRGRSEGGGVKKPALVGLVLGAALAALSHQAWRNANLDPERLETLVGGLLHNVYRAFDYRGEEAVYDVLARSVSGDLLNDVYLETRRGLELANQGGAQVKVQDVQMVSTALAEDDGDTLSVEARWNVAGSVGHWGHVHQRTNAYHANLQISDVDGAWKLTGLEILSEERLEAQPGGAARSGP